VLLLLAAWLFVIGYGLLYAGISNFWGAPVGILSGLTAAK
jgi:hypothetical protein